MLLGLSESHLNDIKWIDDDTQRHDVIELFQLNKADGFVLNKYKDKIDDDVINIMRPSQYGNPYPLFNTKDKNERLKEREKCVAKYLYTLLLNPSFIRFAKTNLRGNKLMCCCSPQLCHGNVLYRLSTQTNLFIESLSDFIQNGEDVYYRDQDKDILNKSLSSLLFNT